MPTTDTEAAAVREQTSKPLGPAASGWWRSAWTLPEVRWATAATVLFLAGLVVDLAGGPVWGYWSLFLACYVAGGWEPGWAGLQELRNKRLDVDLLMVAAAIGAASIGQVLDGGLLIVIFATSGALEAVATKRTEDSVRGLLDLAPETATRVATANVAEELEELVRVADLAVGDVIFVRPGERIGADGTVLDGGSEVDQATITGEPLPVDKTIGDEVFAGTLNGTGALRIRVDRPAAESVVARIAGLVEEAARTKAKTQLFIEKIEQRYSIGMVAATVALFVIPLLFGQPVTPTLLRAMTFMIVASPCAVVLATMPPLLAAIANAGRHGVLVKSAVVMEQLGATTQVAIDKTGTLTRGTPHLAAIKVLEDAPFTRDEVLVIAASAEHPSEHPLAAAVVSAARTAGLALLPVQAFTATAGLGVTATVDGRQVQIGAPAAFLIGSANRDQAARSAIAELQETGATAVVVLVDGDPVAVLGIVDQLRAEAAAAVKQLTQLTGKPPVLLTGDNAATAGEVASAVGITDIHAELLPDGKVAAVRDLQAAGERVTVVGDGINDAPALAAAQAGIAMGRAGSDLTLQTADAVVVRDDLTTIPAVIALSRRARRVVTANLIIAATFITVLVIWDLVGHLPLPLGVAGHEGSTVIVGLNGLRLLRSAAWNRAANQTAQRR
ncbi:heavy metal translocating P-type ATPase [Kribbella italica]|uniref:Heavy metal translocating P-type ATPase n=1 Tax=Kribbella italica TaxID=1540520 RepID=A0A7W9J559_9ACTN|nr:heavy metal translocating P-type ATPase [Kribbella italica]MBB5835804.1 heavy metal translocating P-type ATPase [Kribbella italica]